jgi:hypothetical protein
MAGRNDSGATDLLASALVITLTAHATLSARATVERGVNEARMTALRAQTGRGLCTRRRSEALIELVAERRSPLLVFGPEWIYLRKRLYAKAAKAVRERLAYSSGMPEAIDHIRS